MTVKRMLWTLGFLMNRSAHGRANYARKHGIFAGVGKNVLFQPRSVPIYSQLIRFHDNIVVAKNVDFCTHDMIHTVLNRVCGEKQYSERVGCIEIMDNVFIGSNSVILYDTKIGPNVIIASGSVVVRDCEPNSVCAGCPARKVSDFKSFTENRKKAEDNGTICTISRNQYLSDNDIDKAWTGFDQARQSR